MTSPRQNPSASGFITLDHDPLATDGRSAAPAFGDAQPPPAGYGEPLPAGYGEPHPAGYGDRPGYGRPSRSGLRRPVHAPLWAVVVATVVVGLVIGIGTHMWDASQVRRFQSGAVSVLLTVPGTSTFQTSGDGASATLNGDLQVVNTGPRIIEVGQISSSTPGVTVVRDATSLVIAAGAARSVDLSMKINCAQWSPAEPLVFLLVVRTVDGARRGYVAALALNDTPWGNGLKNACAPGSA